MMIVASNSLTVSNVNDGTITHLAYSWSADGTGKFMTVYPGENLLLDSQTQRRDSSWFSKNWGWAKDIGTYLGSNINRPSYAFDNDRYSYKDLLDRGVINTTDDFTYSVYFRVVGEDPAGMSYAKIQFFSTATTKHNNVPMQLTSLKEGQWARVVIPLKFIDVEHDPDPQADWNHSIRIEITAAPKVAGAHYEFAAPKLEKGSIATPYTPSPLDDPEGAYPKFIGTYTDYIADDSTDPSKYTWAKMRGEQGERGKQIFKSSYEDPSNQAGCYWSDLSPAPSVDNPPKIGDTVITPAGNIFQINIVNVGGGGGGGTFGVGNVLGNIKGPSGTDGKPGKDGVGIKTTVITYAISTSGTTAPTTSWTTSVPSLVKGQYLWTKTVWTYTDNSFETGYSVTYISKDGNNGNDGLAGKDGTGIKTTTIMYAGSTSGTTAPTSGWTSTVPTVAAGSYLWTKTVWAYTDNTSETGYSVAMMGVKGDTGSILGENQWIGYKYSYPESTRIYPNFDHIKGLNPIVTQIFDDSTTFSFNDDYYIAHFQSNLYVNIDKQITTTVSHDDDLTIYCNDEVVVSENTTIFAPYNIIFNLKAGWNKIDVLLHEISGDDQVAFGTKISSLVEHLSYIKGPKGDQGDTGAQGATTYTWIKYATDSSGSNISDTPTGMTYIGIAPNKTTSTESSTTTDYKWSLIKGDQGIPGKTGADGKTSYFHIAYANSSNGSTGFTTSPSASASYNYMGTYSDYTSTSSQSYSSYKWVAMFDSTKKRNFTTQPTTPYAVGDTWTQSGATYFCTTARNSGAFTASDWTMQQLKITSLDSNTQTNLNNSVKTTGTYKGVTLNDTGLTATAGSTTVAMNSTDGFLINNNIGQVFHVDTAGNLTMQGDITAGNISGVNFTGNSSSLANTLNVTGAISASNGNTVINSNGLTIKGGNLSLQDSSGHQTTYLQSDGTFVTNKGVFSGSVSASQLIVNGGDKSDINLGGGKFHVDNLGNLFATLVNGTINSSVINGSQFLAGDTYPSLLDGDTHNNVTIDTRGVQTGDVYASDLDSTEYVTVSQLNYSTTNTANTSTTVTADINSPTLFIIDGSKLSNGDRVLVKLDINYNNYEGKLGSLIALQSVSSSPSSFSSQSLTTGYYTYSFIITWSTALGTGKVNFRLKSTGLQASSNFYVIGANFYTDHGTGTTNYYETRGGLDADGSIRLKDYYSGTNQYAINKIYHGYELDRGMLRLSEYNYDYDVASPHPTITAPYSETQLSGSGIRFLVDSNDPILEFFGSIGHESLIAASEYTPWGVTYTGARSIANGIYFDKFGNIFGYPSSGEWSLNDFNQRRLAQFPLNNKSDIILSPPSGYNLQVNGTIITPWVVKASAFNDFKMSGNNIKAASGDGFFLDNAGGYGGNADLHVRSVSQMSLLSLKTNIAEIDSGTALNLIKQTKIYDYQFKEDIANGVTKHYASYIIDDVNDTPQYKEPEEFLSNNKKGRDDGSLLSYTVLAIQELSKQVDTLKQQISNYESNNKEG